MQPIGSSVSMVAKAFSDSIADSDELKLLPHLSPNSKSKLVKQIHERKMVSMTTPVTAATPADNFCVTPGSVSLPMTEQLEEQ